MPGEISEEIERFFDGHVQHIGDRLAAIVDFERLGVVAFAVADLAGDVDIRQEVHLDALDALALAGFAAAALDVEAEPPRFVAADFGFAGLGKDLADLVKHTRISGGVGSRGPADGGLVDLDDLVDLVGPGNRLVRPGLYA